MNINASIAPSIPAPGRMDAATTTDLPADTGDGMGPTGEAVDFGRILSDTVSKDAAPTTNAELTAGTALVAAFADPKGLFAATGDAGIAVAVCDQPSPLDLNAILGGRLEPAKGTSADPIAAAGPTDDTKDPLPDDLSAQLALLSQWTAQVPPVAKTPASGEDADPAVATRALPSPAATPLAVGAAPSAGPRSPARNADAAMVAAVDSQPTHGTIAPAALDVAALATGRSARPANAPAVGSTAKTDSSKSDDATRLASPDGVTAAIEKAFNLAITGATSTASDAGSIAGQFVTQIAAHVSNAQGSLATVATASSAALREAVATPAWSHELGQAAIRMATDDLQHASLRLNPEHLGPLDVQLRIDNGIAHMQFTAAHADTRAALEGSRATLDQMFGDQGIKLGDWSVGNSSANSSFARQFGAASSQGDGNRSPSGDGDVPDGSTIVTMRATRPLGLVDTFA